MRWLVAALLLLASLACASSEYRFDHIEDGQTIRLPLKFDSLTGRRDGYNVTATARFSEGGDSAEINIVVFLRPPAEFTSGTYKTSIEGRSLSGSVQANSLTFLGGQASAPSIGGIFVLNNEAGRPAYRVTMPATPLQRR
jgi:hypothetical protein